MCKIMKYYGGAKMAYKNTVYNSIFVTNMENMRIKAKLTKQQLASMANIPPTVLSEYASLFKPIPLEHAVRISDAFGVTLNEMLNRYEETPYIKNVFKDDLRLYYRFIKIMEAITCNFDIMNDKMYKNAISTLLLDLGQIRAEKLKEHNII